MSETTYRSKHDLETARGYINSGLNELSREKNSSNAGYIASLEVGFKNLLDDINKLISLL